MLAKELSASPAGLLWWSARVQMVQASDWPEDWPLRDEVVETPPPQYKSKYKIQVQAESTQLHK